jgi:hypothetical protein
MDVGVFMAGMSHRTSRPYLRVRRVRGEEERFPLNELTSRIRMRDLELAIRWENQKRGEHWTFSGHSDRSCRR